MNHREIVPPKLVKTDFPVIDTDPHFKRVVGYARRSDWAVAAGTAASAPALMMAWNKFQPPARVGPAGIASTMRVAVFVGISAGFLRLYTRSSVRFWGWAENSREVEMDMKEMVAKVRAKEPLYGVSNLDPYMQGVAARNSRYSQLFMHLIPWFNFVNHNQHGVDTSKYFRAAEEQIEAEQGLKN
ncbi:C-terminal of NADH-ubiquinone oxidoreductase 21 kDa subunit-domain-containing protein [Geopyxis carbonaria]|nr:C-terminal of NADH-ubiquinone oxidoreductase 21 kDa subunit-domain-containing protein [Geopyxis carbonaria]